MSKRFLKFALFALLGILLFWYVGYWRASGRVEDAITGKPIPGIPISWVELSQPLLGNPMSDGGPISPPVVDSALSGPEGEFAVGTWFSLPRLFRIRTFAVVADNRSPFRTLWDPFILYNDSLAETAPISASCVKCNYFPFEFVSDKRACIEAEAVCDYSAGLHDLHIRLIPKTMNVDDCNVIQDEQIRRACRQLNLRWEVYQSDLSSYSKVKSAMKLCGKLDANQGFSPKDCLGILKNLVGKSLLEKPMAPWHSPDQVIVAGPVGSIPVEAITDVGGDPFTGTEGYKIDYFDKTRAHPGRTVLWLMRFEDETQEHTVLEGLTKEWNAQNREIQNLMIGSTSISLGTSGEEHSAIWRSGNTILQMRFFRKITSPEVEREFLARYLDKYPKSN